MSINGITVNVGRGFDVCAGRSGRVLRSFTSYAEAWAFAAAGRGRYVRYWAEKGE